MFIKSFIQNVAYNLENCQLILLGIKMIAKYRNLICAMSTVCNACKLDKLPFNLSHHWTLEQVLKLI